MDGNTNSIHILDENVATLVSTMDKERINDNDNDNDTNNENLKASGDLAVHGLQLLVQDHISLDCRNNPKGQLNQSGMPGTSTNSHGPEGRKQGGAKENSAKPGESSSKRGVSLGDSSTHVISFQATSGGNLNDDAGVLSSSNAPGSAMQREDKLRHDQSPCSDSPGMTTNHERPKVSDHTDSGEDRGTFTIETDQGNGCPETDATESVGDRLDKFLELAKVELRPMSRQADNEQDSFSTDEANFNQIHDADDTSRQVNNSELSETTEDTVTQGNSGNIGTAQTSEVSQHREGISPAEHLTCGEKLSTLHTVDHCNMQTLHSSELGGVVSDNEVQQNHVIETPHSVKYTGKCNVQQAKKNKSHGPDQFQKSTGADILSRDYKGINKCTRSNDRTIFRNKLSGIDETINVDSQASSRGHEQKEYELNVGDHSSQSIKAENLYNVDTDQKPDLGSNKGDNISPNTNILKTSAAILLMTPSVPSQQEVNHFSDERESDQFSNNVDNGDICFSKGNETDPYAPFAKSKFKLQKNNTGKEQKPFVSLFEKPFTKRELRHALPRKSTFSCHDRSMKDAGIAVDDPVSRRKAERLQAKLAAIANSINPVASIIPTAPAKQAGEMLDAVQIIVTDTSNGNTPKKDDEENAVIETIAESNESNKKADDETDSAEFRSRRPSFGKKKRPSSARIEYIECRPLSHYLEYIKDNRQEYLHHVHTSRPVAKDKPIARLIKMGRAFELRHQGGRSKQQDDDVIVMAAKAIRPRTADPGKFSKQQKDKRMLSADPSLRHGRPSSDDKHSRPSSEDKRPHDKTSAGQSSANAKEEEHQKTELEKRKVKAEDWSKCVTTNQLIKAKIQSLRELGTDDCELTKWWEAFRQCHYLRQSYS